MYKLLVKILFICLRESGGRGRDRGEAKNFKQCSSVSVESNGGLHLTTLRS